MFTWDTGGREFSTYGLWQQRQRRPHNLRSKAGRARHLYSDELFQLGLDDLRLLSVGADDMECTDPFAVEAAVLGEALSDQHRDPVGGEQF
jgi:hypothetical protein